MMMMAVKRRLGGGERRSVRFELLNLVTTTRERLCYGLTGHEHGYGCDMQERARTAVELLAAEAESGGHDGMYYACMHGLIEHIVHSCWPTVM